VLANYMYYVHVHVANLDPGLIIVRLIMANGILVFKTRVYLLIAFTTVAYMYMYVDIYVALCLGLSMLFNGKTCL
jgi:hypothetical protein